MTMDGMTELGCRMRQGEERLDLERLGYKDHLDVTEITQVKTGLSLEKVTVTWELNSLGNEIE